MLLADKYKIKHKDEIVFHKDQLNTVPSIERMVIYLYLFTWANTGNIISKSANGTEHFPSQTHPNLLLNIITLHQLTDNTQPCNSTTV
jgi:hypothetical protein